MHVTKKYLDDLTYKVIGCAIEVHKILGPGLLESVYEKCLIKEFELRGIRNTRQIIIPLNYKGLILETDIRLDLLVEDILCVELKAQEGILPVHEATLMSYMRMLYKPKGLLLNFHVVNIASEGKRTFVNDLFASLPDE